MKVKLIDFGYNKENPPYRAHWNDAGIDVCSPIDYTLAPHESKAIGLKFGIETPVEMAAFVMPRSSMCSKGIISNVTPCDCGYTGELHCCLSNVSDEPYRIKVGDRIGQLVFFHIATPDLVLEDEKNPRGEGAFGSTGR